MPLEKLNNEKSQPVKNKLLDAVLVKWILSQQAKNPGNS
jgi:hypothetical protein